jgi:hypothetical protein
VTYTAAGIALGPYPGTFTETGTIEFGPRNLLGFSALTRVEITFHIDSATAKIDGRKFPGPTTSGTPSLCSASETGDIGFSYQTSATEHLLRYEAIIKPTTGGSFADEGRVTFSLQAFHSQTAVGVTDDVVTTAGAMGEDFFSDLLVASPLLPTAKEQCKDSGFLIFGVFENQGDCVSFVTTNGKNEPGKNQR